MAHPLADLFVLFRVEGAKDAEDALSRFSGKAEDAGGTAGEMANAVKAGIAAIVEALARIGEAAVRAFGASRVAAEQFDKAMEKLREDAAKALGAVKLPSLKADLAPEADKGVTTLRDRLAALPGLLGTVARAAQTGFGVVASGAVAVGGVVASGMGTAATAMARVAQGAAQMAGQIQSAMSLASISVLGFSASVGGFVAAGVRFSYVGDQISLYLQRISLAMSGLFRPELTKAIDLLRGVTNWLYSLSEAQRENIARWIMAGAAALATAAILPRIISGITGVIGAVRALTLAILEGEFATGIGAILPVIGAAVAGLVVLNGGMEGVKKVFTSVMEVVRPVFEAVRDFAVSAAKAFEPLFAALGKVFEALKPVMKVLAELAGAVVRALASVLQVLATVLTVIVKILEPIVVIFAKVAEIIGKILVPVIRILAAVLEVVARVVQALFKILEPILNLIVKVVEAIMELLGPVVEVVASVLGKIAEVVESVVDAITKLFGLSGNEKKKDEKKSAGPRGPEAGKVGGPEDITAAFFRMNTAFLNASAGVKDPQQETNDWLRQLYEGQQDQTRAIRGQQPALTR